MGARQGDENVTNAKLLYICKLIEMLHWNPVSDMITFILASQFAEPLQRSLRRYTTTITIYVGIFLEYDEQQN
jgi:hypothetical protein